MVCSVCHKFDSDCGCDPVTKELRLKEALKDRILTVVGFLKHAKEKQSLVLCALTRASPPGYVPLQDPGVESVVSSYFDLDLRKLESEIEDLNQKILKRFEKRHK